MSTTLCTENTTHCFSVAGLSYLIAHSLNEDAYGVVQRDVPRVLEALLSFTTALETYTQELEKLTSASQLSVSEAAAEGSKEETRQYLDRRRQKESEAIGELVGPLLTGKLCRQPASGPSDRIQREPNANRMYLSLFRRGP